MEKFFLYHHSRQQHILELRQYKTKDSSVLKLSASFSCITCNKKYSLFHWNLAQKKPKTSSKEMDQNLHQKGKAFGQSPLPQRHSTLVNQHPFFTENLENSNLPSKNSHNFCDWLNNVMKFLFSDVLWTSFLAFRQEHLISEEKMSDINFEKGAHSLLISSGEMS